MKTTTQAKAQAPGADLRDSELPQYSLDDRTSPPGADSHPRLGRIRTWTRSTLRDLAYAAAVGVWGVVGFTILVTGISVTSSLLFLVVGVFVWIGFAHVLRWTTSVDRALAGWQRQQRVPAVYRRPGAGGLMPYLKTLSSDPQTWKDLAWLGVTSIVGFTCGLVVITAAGLALTYVSMPLWYWAISDPRAEYGVTNLGLFTVDTLGEAGIAAAIALAIIPLVLVLARWCAATHAGLAVRFLGPSPDEARTDDAGAAVPDIELTG